MAESLRILMLEDNRADAELMQFELQEAGFAFTARMVMNQDEFLSELQNSPDLILSDYDLPHYNGALALAEARRRCPDVPFILVTGAVTEDRAIDILTQGAKDYVLKTRLQQRLVPAVRRALAEAAEHRARKRAEEEVHAASLYSRTLIEASLDPLVTISAEGKVMDVNRATEEITGVSRDRIIGTDFSDYFTEPEKARSGYKKVFSEGSVTDYPLAIRHITGRITDVLYNATTYLDKEGKVQGVFAAARDVTKLKKAEEDLLDAHKHLESQIAERTADLQQEIEQRCRVEKSLLRHNEQLEILSYTASRLLASDKPQQLVEELCLKVMGFLDCDAFFNFLVDEAAGRLHLNACAGIPEETMREIEWLDYGVAVCGCVARDARRIVAENIPTIPDVRTELVKSLGIKAYACHPLMEQDRVLGTLSFGTRTRDGFSQDDLTMMNAVADQVAIAMARLRTGESLRRSEDRYRMLAETMLQGVVHQNARGDVIAMNPAAERILGKSRGDFIGSSAVEEGRHTIRENGEPFPGVEHPSMVALRTGKPVNGVIMGVFNPKLGEYRWIRIDAMPVFSPGERNPSEVYTAFEDITERKRTEEALRKSEQLYRAIGESIDYGVWVCDPDGRNVYTSQSFLDLVGLTQEQCSSFGWGDVLHPDDAEKTIAAWKECVRTKGIWDIEHRCRGVDGQWHPILARGVPVRDEGGKVIYWAGINLDIKNLKQAEADLREQTKRLQAINQELESFTYSVSHDLRAPLRAIDGYAKLLLKQQGEKFDEDTKQKFGVIISNARMMGQLIEDLLSLSRLGRESLSISRLNVEDLIRDVWEELKARDCDRTMDLRIGNLPIARGDRSLIRQVLVNLLSNAIKFTRTREVSLIEVGGHRMETEDLYYVRDNGVGFDMQYHDRLFGVFQRFHRAEDFEGTGIGLAIVQRIINRHGGRVWATSEPGQGATIYFTLPTC